MKKMLLIIYFTLICSMSFGAEFLVLAVDGTDPTHMKKGDIASVRPDGWDWEGTCKACSKPMWKIIKLPGLSVEEAQRYTEQLTEEGTKVVTQEIFVSNKDYDDGSYIEKNNIVNTPTVIKEEIKTYTGTIGKEEYQAISKGDLTVNGKTKEELLSQLEEQPDGNYKYEETIEGKVVSAEVEVSYSNMVRERKYHFPRETINSIKEKSLSVPSKDVDAYKSLITEKDLAAEKMAVSSEISAKEISK